ncbi:MAG: hypothetical protein Q7S87_03235 [Agitococcus sp.]|nr:hypothetical protein [Agitococcus sp.]
MLQSFFKLSRGCFKGVPEDAGGRIHFGIVLFTVLILAAARVFFEKAEAGGGAIGNKGRGVLSILHS